MRSRWLYFFKLAFLFFFAFTPSLSYRALSCRLRRGFAAWGCFEKPPRPLYVGQSQKRSQAHTLALKKGLIFTKKKWLPYTRTFNKDAALKVDDLHVGKVCEV